MNAVANRVPGLSKSRVMSGLQCHRRLWLETFRRDLATVDPSAEALFANGHAVGEKARDLFGPGMLVEHVKELGAALEDTDRLLSTRPDATLFEAAFRHTGVLVRADVLRPVDGGYELIEVKSSTQVKDYQLDDCAVQAWVMENAGVPLRRICIAHVNNAFVYRGANDYRELLVTENTTDAVRARMPSVPCWVSRLSEVLANPEPDTRTGEQCHQPFECPFLAYCHGKEPPGPEYPVTILPRSRKLAAQLQSEGYEDLLEVPPTRLTNPLHRRMQAASSSQQPFVDSHAREILCALGYPRYYLDFETIGFAVPTWIGTRPYQQIPFQWSCHVDRGDGNLEHREFLDLTGNAPMRAFAESLIEVLGGAGPILVYNAAFEDTRIRELASMLPALRPKLLALRPRIFDLLPITRQYYYHAAMKGSWSIKKVLPTIAPELDYAKLEGVATSGDAPLAYQRATNPDTPISERETIRSQLLLYCANDTLAMVKVVERFCQ